MPSKYDIHILLSDYSKSMIDLYNSGEWSKEIVKEEAICDLDNRFIDEIEYNIIMSHIEKY